MSPFLQRIGSALLLVALLMTATASAKAAAAELTPVERSADFAAFDRRAQNGDALNIVFFGASLTWGANASDPNNTSYRGVVARKMQQRYPRARLHFFDAAIGGTNSQLGVFRLQRDVLSHNPDLVFLDFTANDNVNSVDAEKLASYESLVRRLVAEARVPVVQMVFAFKNDVAKGKLDGMKRREAHLAISKAYNTAFGDAIALGQERVRNGEVSIDALWDIDPGHPGDAGYAMFADAAMQAYVSAVARGLVCRAPQKMLHAPTYLTWTRTRISALQPLPTGWKVGRANRISAYYDMLMSRWLDDETVASNRGDVAPERLRARFRGSTVLLFGESTPKSVKYRVYIDGKLLTRKGKDAPVQIFDAGDLGRRSNGNTHHVQLLAEGLDASVEHTLEIEPLFEAGTVGELRLESICVAGDNAQVLPAAK